MAAYTASKAAVLGLTRSLARDYGPFNIRVNARRGASPGQCLKRRLQPDGIARFTVFLASDEASACTNQQYVVDGRWRSGSGARSRLRSRRLVPCGVGMPKGGTDERRRR
jgi:NAD(P)-dependent dehydrogenase (short-subunit alcohol dehydrogenase family)